MLRYVLICIVASMLIYGKCANAGSIKTSDNFLQEIADFDNIVEPESNQNNVETRESNDDDDDDDLYDDRDEKCPGGKCPRGVDTEDTIKDLSNKIGSPFIDKFFAKIDSQDRNLRGADEDDKKDEKEEEGNIINDEQFEEEQQKSANATNSTKELFEQIENNQTPDDKEKEQEECEECNKIDQSSKKAHGSIETMPKKSGLAGSDFLEMHFYKHIPDNENPEENPVFINLYPKTEKSRSFQEKYDYIALLPKDAERRRRDLYAPFVPKFTRHRFYRPESAYFRPSFRHSPHFFYNDMERPGRMSKRFANFDLSNNKYLREADLLIRNLGTSLRMGLDSENSGSPFGNTNQGLVDSEVKSEINPMEVGGVKSEVSPLVGGQSKDDGLVKSEVGVEGGQSRESGLVKNEVGLEGGQNKESLVKSEVSSGGIRPSKEEGLVKRDGLEKKQYRVRRHYFE